MFVTSTSDMLSGLRRQGVKRILLATGDRQEVAERVTVGLGLDGIRAGLTPDQKCCLSFRSASAAWR